MRLRRSPLLFWTTALAVAIVTGVTVSGMVGEASTRASRLGGLVEVTVIARPVAAGDALEAGDVALERLPAALLPRGRVARSPVGRVALVDLVAGEVVLESRLAPGGVTGVAALLPDGLRALAVPVDARGLPLRRGHRVDVLATFDTAEPTDEPTFPVATGAVVLDVGEESVTLAVTPAEAPRLAFALARGLVALALTNEARSERGRDPTPTPTTTAVGR